MKGKLPRYFFRRKNTFPTSKCLSDELPHFLGKLGKSFQERKDLLVASWPSLVGERLATMTRIESFHEGILKVRVSNSTLLSLLGQSEKGRLFRKIKQRFPNVTLSDIKFRIG